MTCWTILIGVSWYWNYQAEQKVFRKVAQAEARAVIERDALYRRWGSSLGGVYTPITPQTPPNPYLSHLPERVISSTLGKQLTLINPAYMTRQVNELAQESSVFIGRAHLTSLKPLRPENSPDPWEEKALRSFETGAEEASDVTNIGGKPFMRLMRPFVTDKTCLKCHASQGYSVGSILGGISVSIPIQPLLDVSRRQIVGSFAFHVMIWLIGLGVTIRGSSQLSESAAVQKRIENELHQQTLQLEGEVTERQAAQKELEELNRSLEMRIAISVTELRKRDQALIQQGRLAAMGEMINNIAHQWRQPLNNIGLIIQNLQFSYETGMLSQEEMRCEVEKAMDVIIYMSHTIDDFRSFFRDDKQKNRFFVSKVVLSALELVTAALTSRKIQVECEDDETVTAFGFQNEYAQVLLNILSNASETCIERGVTAARIHIRITSENGRSIVYIRDNCGGIPEDIMPKIFDPYFTTRAPDRGTGIGLYMSKVIIEQNMGGNLTASNTGDGVEFRIEV